VKCWKSGGVFPGFELNGHAYCTGKTRHVMLSQLAQLILYFEISELTKTMRIKATAKEYEYLK
jgi:hypothetical protein